MNKRTGKIDKLTETGENVRAGVLALREHLNKFLSHLRLFKLNHLK